MVFSAPSEFERGRVLIEEHHCSIAFFGLIVSYTVEILPYSIRAKGLAVFNFTLNLALIFNLFVNPIALQKIGWKYYVRA